MMRTIRLAGSALLILISFALLDDETTGVSRANVGSQGEAHLYFERLRARADLHVAYSLRDHEQLMRWAHGDPSNLEKFPPPQYWIDYVYPEDPDPRRQDAAKVTVPRDSSGSKQARFLSG